MSPSANPMPQEFVHRLEVARDHPAFEGHFPGRPVLPGVALLAEIFESAAAEPSLAECIGPTPRLEVAKFLAPVLPGASLAIRFRLMTGGLEFTIHDGERSAASGRFARAAARDQRP
jgi:3-hydroxymyristoyl/3-hydroxydecanoyl-(acyl carrier protein) dehydratase